MEWQSNVMERQWEWWRDGGNDEDAETQRGDDERLEGLKNEVLMNGMTIKRWNEGIDDRDDDKRQNNEWMIIRRQNDELNDWDDDKSMERWKEWKLWNVKKAGGRSLIV